MPMLVGLVNRDSSAANPAVPREHGGIGLDEVGSVPSSP